MYVGVLGVCMYMYVCMYVYVCMYECICLFVCVYVYIYLFVDEALVGSKITIHLIKGACQKWKHLTGPVYIII